MDTNQFSVIIQAILEKSGITKELSEIQKIVDKNMIKIIPELETASIRNNLKQVSNEIAKTLNKSFGGNFKVTGNDVFKILNQQFKQTSSNTTKMASELSRLSKVSTMQRWADNNSKAMKKFGNEINDIINKMGNLDKELTQAESEKLTAQFRKYQNEAQKTGNIGKTTAEQIKKVWDKLGGVSIVTSALTTGMSQFKEAILEIKELDNTLTEISKTSDLTAKEIKELGMSAYDTASKYGKSANDYLSGVESMSQSGFYGEQGEAMAEQSLLAQAAGDMTQEIADQYVIATNAAYKFNGEAEKINAVLDGQNSISNKNSVALEDMATAMSEAGTTASSYNVAIEDLSAMAGTMEAVTKSGGSEVGNGIKSILINLQNVTSDKITSTLNKANASMTEFVNGAEKLRNPIEILRDLSNTFNQMDKDDPLRAEILTNIGGKYQATKLAALLQNMDMFDKMLVDYSEGKGSALEEANKSADNLTGRLNALSNSWTEFVNNIVNSSTLKGGVNLVNTLLEGLTGISDVLGTINTLFGNINGTFGGIGAISGLLMNKSGIGERTMF